MLKRFRVIGFVQVVGAGSLEVFSPARVRLVKSNKECKIALCGRRAADFKLKNGLQMSGYCYVKTKFLLSKQRNSQNRNSHWRSALNIRAAYHRIADCSAWEIRSPGSEAARQSSSRGHLRNSWARCSRCQPSTPGCLLLNC
jgi:hypothetical protein